MNSEMLRPILDWFSQKLRPIVKQTFINKKLSDTEYYSNPKNQTAFLEFLQQADFAIADIKVTERVIEIPEPLQPLAKQKTGKIKTFISIHQTDAMQAEFDFDTEESTGTRRIASLAPIWLDSLAQGACVLYDELCSSLHPHLVKLLVQLFNDPTKNKHGAQLIFTTHDTSTLSSQIFRKDQIWFCERNPHQATDLYSLLEFRTRKGIDNLEKAYLSGRYGAIPALSNT